MNRRAFLRAGATTTAGALAIGPAFFERAFANGPITVGPGPYGPPGAFDANGISLPAGFTSREIARGGSAVPGGGGYVWHNLTDGQATFRTLTAGAPDGGWILVANSEVPASGGVSGIEFSADGTVERAYSVLTGTSVNCAGGRTPWGTWLSCEEFDNGMVHECDPTGPNVGVAKPALGSFSHEAACVDPVNQRLYLTEDEEDGCLYRFTPTMYPNLNAGLLEVAVGTAPGPVTWATVPTPGGGPLDPTRDQVAGAATFDGGEGLWFDNGIVYFTTKGDNRVWTLNVATNTIAVLYDEAAVGPDAPLSGVDNITVSQSGDIYVCEDGGRPRHLPHHPRHGGRPVPDTRPGDARGRDAAAPLPSGNETIGVIFNPAGNRMYFGVQRSFGFGAVLRGQRAVPADRRRLRRRPGRDGEEAGDHPASGAQPQAHSEAAPKGVPDQARHRRARGRRRDASHQGQGKERAHGLAAGRPREAERRRSGPGHAAAEAHQAGGQDARGP